MKKLRFNGKINGEQFTNVEDYNAKIQELIKQGEQIDASTETFYEDVCETRNMDNGQDVDGNAEGCSGNCNNCHCKKEQDENAPETLPYFENGKFEIESFFNDYCLEDKSVGEMQNVINTLKHDVEVYINYLKSNNFEINGKKISIDDCEEFAKQISECYDVIKDDIDGCERDINIIEGDLAEMKQELESIKKDRKRFVAENVCLNVYKHALNEILFQLESKHNDNLQPKTSIRTTQEQKETDLNRAFSKLMSFILK